MSDTEIGQTKNPPETSVADTEAPKPAPKRKGGRPRKSRGGGNSSDAANARWTVRGIPTNVRDMATKAADNRGMTVGDWIAEAIVKHSRADKDGVSADAKTNVPAVEVLPDLPDLLAKMNKRLTELENQKQTGFVGRLFGRR
jgi:hypothetical protein